MSAILRLRQHCIPEHPESNAQYRWPVFGNPIANRGHPGNIILNQDTFVSFTPEFLKWTLLSLNLDISIFTKWGYHSKMKN